MLARHLGQKANCTQRFTQHFEGPMECIGIAGVAIAKILGCRLTELIKPPLWK